MSRAMGVAKLALAGVQNDKVNVPVPQQLRPAPIGNMAMKPWPPLPGRTSRPGPARRSMRASRRTAAKTTTLRVPNRRRKRGRQRRPVEQQRLPPAVGPAQHRHRDWFGWGEQQVDGPRVRPRESDRVRRIRTDFLEVLRTAMASDEPDPVGLDFVYGAIEQGTLQPH